MIDFQDKYTLLFGDSITLLETLEENSIDTCITDPPSGINFMGKKWDNHSKYTPRTPKGITVYETFKGLLKPWEVGFLAFTVDWAILVLRALKPGALALVWGLPRTVDLTAMGLRIAGFEIRDTLAHIYGQGNPKGQNISKAIDEKAGQQGEAIRRGKSGKSRKVLNEYAGEYTEYAPATDAAKVWHGFNTQLKPAREDWLIAMKPLEKTFVHNALKWGVAGLNIDAARVAISSNDDIYAKNSHTVHKPENNGLFQDFGESVYEIPKGRWPANLTLAHTPACQKVGEREIEGRKLNRFTDGAKPFGGGAGHGFTSSDTGPETVELWDCPEDCPVRMLDEQSGQSESKQTDRGKVEIFKKENGWTGESTVRGHNDSGGASRFFYISKPGDEEKNLGLSKHEENEHVTVKPLDLMVWLCKLTRPPGGGIVLDPFMGSGTTGMGCMITQRKFIGMEREETYYKIAQRRLKAPLQPELLIGV